MSHESRLEFKVGFFVLLALLGLSFFIVSVTDLSFAKKGYTIEAIFGFVNGLGTAAPVRLAGVEAGIVRDLKVFVDDKDQRKIKIRTILWIQEGIQMPDDSEFSINQLGLFGEKYVEITPGKSLEPLKSAAVVIGQDPVPIEKITEKVALLTDKIEKTVDGINDGILTEQNKKSLAQILVSFNEIMTNAKDGHGTVGRLLADESVYRNLEELTADLKSNPWKLLYRPKEK